MTEGSWSAGEMHEDARQPAPLSKIIITLVGVLLFALVAWLAYSAASVPPHHTAFSNQSQPAADAKKLSVWWGDVPRKGTAASLQGAGVGSNIHPGDYVGAEACRECHRKNYENWSRHPHRWMNAEARSANVHGDFTGKTLSYRGGEASFYVEQGRYRMKLVREHERTYVVSRTIGSRFFQYYVGTQVTGPESPLDVVYQQEHVLPFGYWLGPQEWVPVVHIGHERSDGRRVDPFAPLPPDAEFVDYARGCNVCHTTFAMGDLFCKETRQISREIPVDLHWSAANYLDDVRPELLGLPSESQAAHSHHPAGSEGSRCMNCHMPRLNEGMQDVVRTHTIFSPTNREMIHANQPNACNQCHTDKPIDWTLRYLSDWYGADFDSRIIAGSYPNRAQPASINWLRSDNEAVRLVAADALFRTKSEWALNELIDALDDPYLLNRQFARLGIEEMKGVQLEQEFGYRFFMTPAERREPIERLRKESFTRPYTGAAP